MKKLSTAVLMLAVSFPAFADWVSYQRNADTEELYDSAIISREGKRIKLWTLTNYAKPITSLEGKELLSEKALTTIDCEAKKVGSEKVMKYTGKNAQGDHISTMETMLRLTTVQKGSADEALLGRLCQ